jgi:hypothetical protein
MYLGLFNKNNTHSLTNSRRIATPVSGFRSHTIVASQTKGHWGSKMCSEDILEGGLELDRKRVHRKRDNFGKIFSPRVRRMENYFKGFTVEHIDRNKNTKTNKLAKGVARKHHFP